MVYDGKSSLNGWFYWYHQWPFRPLDVFMWQLEFWTTVSLWSHQVPPFWGHFKWNWTILNTTTAPSLNLAGTPASKKPGEIKLTLYRCIFSKYYSELPHWDRWRWRAVAACAGICSVMMPTRCRQVFVEVILEETTFDNPIICYLYIVICIYMYIDVYVCTITYNIIQLYTSFILTSILLRVQ